jgi:hypothetical protein
VRLLRREEREKQKPSREVTDRLREYRQLTHDLAEYRRTSAADSQRRWSSTSLRSVFATRISPRPILMRSAIGERVALGTDSQAPREMAGPARNRNDLDAGSCILRRFLRGMEIPRVNPPARLGKPIVLLGLSFLAACTTSAPEHGTAAQKSTMCRELDSMLGLVESHIADARDLDLTPRQSGRVGFQRAITSPEFTEVFERYVRAAYRWDLDRMRPLVEEIARAIDSEDFLRFSAASIRAFALCNDTLSPGDEAASESPASEASSEESREELAAAIRGRLETLIHSRDLPYEVTQAEFQIAGPEAQQQNLPEGAWWVVQFEDPLETGRNSTLPVRDLAINYPLELYRDSLRPHFGEMDFVVNYIISFRDPQQSVFQIDPFQMRLYQQGDITTRQMARMMVITSL